MITNSIYFTKMHGLGNDIVLVDTLKQPFVPQKEQIRAWSHRHTGIGFDQLILLQQSKSAEVDFNYQVFNADGSLAQQCGNGLRCLGLYLDEKNLLTRSPVILSNGYLISRLWLKSAKEIMVDMGVPNFEPASLPFLQEKCQTSYSLSVLGTNVILGAVSLGNPHVVLFVDDINQVDMVLAHHLSKHPYFPEQVNVSFVELCHKQQFKQRVYERGTGETLACGSGACAAMVVARLCGKVDEDCQVILPGGLLNIAWQGQGSSVFMTGSAVKVFEGSITIPKLYPNHLKRGSNIE